MGGCTITKLATSLTQLFSDMEKAIINAESAGLGVDSELVVIDPTKDKARFFKATLKYDETIPMSFPTGVTFEEVKDGRYFHVGVAGKFGPKPGEGQLVGTIHVHT